MHAGIFGRTLCGKTTLAKQLSAAYWRGKTFRSLVLDPNGENWGQHAYVTTCRERFLGKVWSSRNCMVFADEAGMTINRDRELIDLFTRIRHNGHKFHVMAHTSGNLLPVMREQLIELYLFRQSYREAELWAELFMDPAIMQACGLNFEGHEFLHAKLGGEVARHILRLDSK